MPSDIETLKGEQILTNDFNMGSFSMVIVENMGNKDILKLEDTFREIKGVNKVGNTVKQTILNQTSSSLSKLSNGLEELTTG